jgi:hypothetical protein
MEQDRKPFTAEDIGTLAVAVYNNADMWHEAEIVAVTECGGFVCLEDGKWWNRKDVDWHASEFVRRVIKPKE